jgi:hypothetical protein
VFSARREFLFTFSESRTGKITFHFGERAEIDMKNKSMFFSISSFRDTGEK